MVAADSVALLGGPPDQPLGKILTAAPTVAEDPAVLHGALPDHPLVTQEMAKITGGGKLPPLVDSAQAGAAEALYGIGASIGRRERTFAFACRDRADG